MSSCSPFDVFKRFSGRHEKEIKRDIFSFKKEREKTRIMYKLIDLTVSYEERYEIQRIIMKIGKLLYKKNNLLFMVIGRNVEVIFDYDTDKKVVYVNDIKNDINYRYFEKKKHIIASDLFDMVRVLLGMPIHNTKQKKIIKQPIFQRNIGENEETDEESPNILPQIHSFK